MLSAYTATMSDYRRADQIPLHVVEVASGHPKKLFHSHQYSELVLVLYGEAKHLVGNCSCMIHEGDLLLLHPGIIHGYDKTDYFGIINLTYDYQKLGMPVLDGYELPLFQRMFPSQEIFFTEEEQCRPAAALSKPKLHVFVELIRDLKQELENPLPGNFYLSLAMFMSIMARIARDCAESCEKHRMMFRIGEVIEYMHRNLGENVDVDMLVKEARISRRSFFRLFRNMTGCTPQEYRTQLRLKQSIELLRDSYLSIGEIALKCGFYDANHFCRVFRKHLRTSPRKFRLL